MEGQAVESDSNFAGIERILAAVVAVYVYKINVRVGRNGEHKGVGRVA